MTVHRLAVVEGAYVDSVRLMQLSRRLRDRDGVGWAAAVMGIGANLDDLREQGFDDAALDGAGGDDLVVAVRADSEEAARGALDGALGALREPAAESLAPGGAEKPPPRTLGEARERLPEANVAVVSVPGEYAALEAHKALSAGLHVLLFSDNVPLSDEIVLKKRAAARRLLLMGPGAGTAWLGGVGLGFANAVRAGPVGVVAAAGTGAQEVATLLDRWGAGVSHVIGVGGRDLSRDVGAVMTKAGIKALEADEDTRVVLLVSKPPHPEVAGALLGELGDKPAVVALLGLDDGVRAPSDVTLRRSLEGAVLATVRALQLPDPDPARGLADLATQAIDRLPAHRRALRGLFSGGTLCYETLVAASQHLGPVYSNTPLRPDWGLPAPDGAHICLDLGEEEYTRGRPHPMIDPEARAEHIVAAGEDPDTAVVLIDVVLGHGAHPDPASVLAAPCAGVTGRADAPAVVAYVLGSDRDPQDRDLQCQCLQEAGCLLAPTATRAALLASAIAARVPVFAEVRN